MTTTFAKPPPPPRMAAVFVKPPPPPRMVPPAAPTPPVKRNRLLAAAIALLIASPALASVRLLQNSVVGNAVVICPLGLIASGRVTNTNGKALAGFGIRDSKQLSGLLMDDLIERAPIGDGMFAPLGLVMMQGMRPFMDSTMQKMIGKACHGR